MHEIIHISQQFSATSEEKAWGTGQTPFQNCGSTDRITLRRPRSRGIHKGAAALLGGAGSIVACQRCLLARNVLPGVGGTRPPRLAPGGGNGKGGDQIPSCRRLFLASPGTPGVVSLNRPAQSCSEPVQDGGSSGLRPRFLRMDSPLSSMRKALWTNRSRILSATEGSPICSCQ
jgi:hypothetical protein